MTDLHQLVGLVLPDNVSWWPLAAGWYILFLLLMCVLLFVVYKRRINYIKNSYRRAALSQIEQLSLTNAHHLLAILHTTVNHSIEGNSIEGRSIEGAVELQQAEFLSHLNKGIEGSAFDDQDWQLLRALAFQAPQQNDQLEEQFFTLKAKCQQWVRDHHYEY